MKRMTYIFAAALVLLSAPSFAANDAPVSKTLFTNVNVFDGKHEKLINNASVLVEGNLIKQVSTKPISADGAAVIDGGGRTLMPGLIGTHQHLNQGGLTPEEIGDRPR